jgi:SAM-dependent methyltransferase
MGICRGCGLAYAHPLSRGGNDEVGDADSTITNPAFYEGVLREYEHQSAAAAKKVPLQFRYWSGILGRQLRSVLEVGCGTGQYYKGWKQLCVSWQGAEVNPAMIDFCLARGMPVSSLDALKGQTFDAVFMSQVLEHSLTPQRFLQAVRGFLVPGGVLHIDVPNHGSLASLVRRIAGSDYGAVQPMHHLLGYSGPPLRRLLESAGFNIVHIGAHTNDDPLFGQLGPFRWLGKLHYLAGGAIGRGSMLVAVARKPHWTVDS